MGLVTNSMQYDFRDLASLEYRVIPYCLDLFDEVAITRHQANCQIHPG